MGKEKSIALVKELTMTKKEVAKKTGISTTWLHKIETGKEAGFEWSKRLAKEAKAKGRKLIKLAEELEKEAA